ncbi:MAG: DNA alkylation repair protein, partial [Candidatus Helarchaeota archaeon]
LNLEPPMHPYLIPLQNAFESGKNPENAFWMKKYMKDQFEFYGIKTPERRKILKSFLKEQGLPGENDLVKVIKECWSFEQREWQYIAVGILEKYVKNLYKDIMGLLEFMITYKSWWDTVDGIASCLLGPYFKKYPGMILPKTGEWMNSGNIWLQRTCLLFQLKYKDTTDTRLLFGFIEKLSGSESFWIRKAIGWSLREYHIPFLLLAEKKR